MAIKIIKKNGWTPVEEQLPPEDSTIMAYTSTGLILNDMMYKPKEYPDTDWIAKTSLWNGRVIAWMKLPERDLEKLKENGWTLVEEELPPEDTIVIALTAYRELMFDMMYKPKEHPDHDWITKNSRWRGHIVGWKPKIVAPEIDYI